MLFEDDIVLEGRNVEEVKWKTQCVEINHGKKGIND